MSTCDVRKRMALSGTFLFCKIMKFLQSYKKISIFQKTHVHCHHNEMFKIHILLFIRFKLLMEGYNLLEFMIMTDLWYDVFL